MPISADIARLRIVGPIPERKWGRLADFDQLGRRDPHRLTEWVGRAGSGRRPPPASAALRPRP